MGSFDPLQTRMFTSPWAVKREDEEFFMSTLGLVGAIVGQDIKLGTLFYTLNIITPGGNLSPQARVGGQELILILTHHFQNDPGLKKIQKEVSLLLFRYLKNKFRSSEEASKTMRLLLRLVGNLHTCLSIHLHGRPERGTSFCNITEPEEREQLVISPRPQPPSYQCTP